MIDEKKGEVPLKELRKGGNQRFEGNLVTFLTLASLRN